jgi:hypothetical protein
LRYIYTGSVVVEEYRMGNLRIAAQTLGIVLNMTSTIGSAHHQQQQVDIAKHPLKQGIKVMNLLDMSKKSKKNDLQMTPLNLSKIQTEKPIFLNELQLTKLSTKQEDHPKLKENAENQSNIQAKNDDNMNVDSIATSSLHVAGSEQPSTSNMDKLLNEISLRKTQMKTEREKPDNTDALHESNANGNMENISQMDLKNNIRPIRIVQRLSYKKIRNAYNDDDEDEFDAKRSTRRNVGKCKFCKLSFVHVDRHCNTCRLNPKRKVYECPLCQSNFTRKENVTRHIVNTHRELIRDFSLVRTTPISCQPANGQSE